MSPSDERRSRIDSALMQQPSPDPRPFRERLGDYASRGMDSPESLDLHEIRQLSFALALYLSIDDED